MNNDVYDAEPLDFGRASSLLHDAWLVEDEGSKRVRAACVHRVLVLEVESTGAATPYRGPASGARRTIVGTFEPLRSLYLADLGAASLAWQIGAPPEWLDARVSAALVAHGISDARITRWAEEDVAEVHLSRVRTGEFVASPGFAVEFVGMRPVRHIGTEGKVPPRVIAAGLALCLLPLVLGAFAVGPIVTHFGLLGLPMYGGAALLAFAAGCVTLRPRRSKRAAAAMRRAAASHTDTRTA